MHVLSCRECDDVLQNRTYASHRSCRSWRWLIRQASGKRKEKVHGKATAELLLRTQTSLKT